MLPSHYAKIFSVSHSLTGSSSWHGIPSPSSLNSRRFLTSYNPFSNLPPSQTGQLIVLRTHSIHGCHDAFAGADAPASSPLSHSRDPAYLSSQVNKHSPARVECHLANRSYTIRDSNTCKIEAIAECTIPN